MVLAADPGKPGRPQKPADLRAKTRTLAAYNSEWDEVKRLAAKYKTPFDLFRYLIREKYPAARGEVREPRRANGSIPDR